MAKKPIIKPFKKIPAHQDDIHNPIIIPPRRLRDVPKYTVEKLLNLANAKKKELAKDIAVKSIKTMDLPVTNKLFDPETTLTYRIQTYSKHNKHIHNVTIFCVEGSFGLDKKVLVDCSCSSHIFQCEYNLARVGNAMLWRCNGQAPTQNLTMQTCKHTYTALRVMLRRQKSDMLPAKTRIRKKLSLSRGN